jgi:anti-sigma factor RsiW
MMHLGSRVSALLDGQMSPAEEERAWSHVHTCPTCRAAVEREGWVKRQLAYLSLADSGPAPNALKGSLCSRGAFASYPDFVSHDERGRRLAGLAAIGAGSVGAAMFAVLALSAAPAEAPVMDRRAPVSSLLTTPAPNPGPARSGNQDAAAAVKLVVSTLVRMGM